MDFEKLSKLQKLAFSNEVAEKDEQWNCVHTICLQLLGVLHKEDRTALGNVLVGPLKKLCHERMNSAVDIQEWTDYKPAEFFKQAKCKENFKFYPGGGIGSKHIPTVDGYSPRSPQSSLDCTVKTTNVYSFTQSEHSQQQHTPVIRDTWLPTTLANSSVPDQRTHQQSAHNRQLPTQDCTPSCKQQPGDYNTRSTQKDQSITITNATQRSSSITEARIGCARNVLERADASHSNIKSRGVQPLVSSIFTTSQESLTHILQDQQDGACGTKRAAEECIDFGRSSSTNNRPRLSYREQPQAGIGIATSVHTAWQASTTPVLEGMGQLQDDWVTDRDGWGKDSHCTQDSPPEARVGGFVSARAKLAEDSNVASGRYGQGMGFRHGSGADRGVGSDLLSGGFPQGGGPLGRGWQDGARGLRAGAEPGRGRGLAGRGPPRRAGKGGFVPPFLDQAGGGQGRPGGGAGPSRGPQGSNKGAEEEHPSGLSDLVLQKLLPHGGELPECIAQLEPSIVERVCSEIMESKPGTTWDTIAGLEDAKRTVHEVVVWPMKNPRLFTGPRAPPKGILLFGPPGTGKSLIGKAIATECGATFFSISASSLTSKWIGEGEKMVRCLFTVARHLHPSVIFVDEIDSLLSSRKSEGEHEASRRMKNEFLVQMEGADSDDTAQARTLLVGATNRPQELDDAARRRLSKQLYIPLPCAKARRQMIDIHLRGVNAGLSSTDWDKVCEKTEGYSGSDMRLLVMEAANMPVRELMDHFKRTNQGDVADIDANHLRPVSAQDFRKALKKVKPSVTASDVEQYLEWNNAHGAHSLGQESQSDDDGEW